MSIAVTSCVFVSVRGQCAAPEPLPAAGDQGGRPPAAHDLPRKQGPVLRPPAGREEDHSRDKNQVLLIFIKIFMEICLSFCMEWKFVNSLQNINIPAYQMFFCPDCSVRSWIC